MKDYCDYDCLDFVAYEEKYSALFTKCSDNLIKLKEPTTYFNDKNKVLKNEFLSDHVQKQFDLMLEHLEDDPTLVIGTAKELVETCFKTILDKLEIEYENDDIPALTKKVCNSLTLIPNIVSDDKKIDKIIKSFLGTIKQIPISISELRNSYGSGHGKSDNYIGLDKDYSKLVYGVTLAYMEFILSRYKQTLSKKYEATEVMYATITTFLSKLLGCDNRKFIIPIYQRKYKRTSEECFRLIDDIINAGLSKKPHFLGVVVYQSLNTGSFTNSYLVDGQQRVTTVLLLLKCLQLISLNFSDADAEYVCSKVTGLLYADKDDKCSGLKLTLSKYDNEIFEIILNSPKYEEALKNPVLLKNESSAVFTNFKLMYSKVFEYVHDGKTLRSIILEGLQLLTIVEMSLDKEDDPQAIFESINSLGLKLSNADLIRNYLLMSHSNQIDLYTKYREIIQDNFIGENNMESFVFNYLLMKKSYPIKNEDVYKEYVKFASSEFGTSPQDKENLLIDLFKLAKIYQVFIRNSDLYSANTNMLMQEFRDMDLSTAYPFLMKVFLDFDSEIIDEATLNKVINLLVIYLVRRTICGVPTNTLRGFLLNLYNRVFKIESNKQRYFESIYAFLTQIGTNDKLITDNKEIEEALKTAEIYKKNKFATYLLYKIENGRYPNPYSEFTLANNISIEHIMPQTLTDQWVEMLGYGAEEIHNKYLDTLGNLSLSSRSKNSIMSNEEFTKKERYITYTMIKIYRT